MVRLRRVVSNRHRRDEIVAVKTMDAREMATTVVTLVADSGLKYRNMDLYQSR